MRAKSIEMQEKVSLITFFAWNQEKVSNRCSSYSFL
jgi:hypothetical protein